MTWSTSHPRSPPSPSSPAATTTSPAPRTWAARRRCSSSRHSRRARLGAGHSREPRGGTDAIEPYPSASTASSRLPRTRRSRRWTSARDVRVASTTGAGSARSSPTSEGAGSAAPTRDAANATASASARFTRERTSGGCTRFASARTPRMGTTGAFGTPRGGTQLRRGTRRRRWAMLPTSSGSSPRTTGTSLTRFGRCGGGAGRTSRGFRRSWRRTASGNRGARARSCSRCWSSGT
mmetsp:Transcript_9874/g.38518  ORF Transcript_9874/g.38518 Transcript_9874/m.38518 type:complete len:236 (-) Transcript_9874:498-1205(-)